jgi:hypothetical protein
MEGGRPRDMHTQVGRRASCLTWELPTPALLLLPPPPLPQLLLLLLLLLHSAPHHMMRAGLVS